MIRRMEDAPRLGLLQTAPVVAGARSRFGRAMQFAAGFHGASYMRGLAALQGATGPFWGHNALIRIRAFAQSCGLPELTGRPPFGGHVLSHDYVEAALLARAGWEVRLDPDLGGSFEESPETILTHARRDRRWCQGNLQYIRLLTAPGLPGWNRFVLLQGILAYVAPVLWLVFLGASLLAGALGGPAYEPVLVPLVGANPFEGSMAEWLMTEWSSPVLEPEMAATALGLALGVLGLLVLPKLLILTEAIRTGRVAGYGGAWRASAGVAAELAVSVMTAPLLLMYQARSVAEVLTGRDGGWPVQARSEGTVPLALSWRASWWITVTGAGLATMAVLLVPNLLVWLSPVCVPMLFAPAVISWTSRPGGSWLFAMPAEQEPPAVVVRFSTILARWRGLPDGATPPTELEPVLNG
jgi:membrane glycosyltransferase